MMQMTAMWCKPYHVAIEVENRQCRILKKFAALGLKHLKVVDLTFSGQKLFAGMINQ
jgi:hypothetical protein